MRAVVFDGQSVAVTELPEPELSAQRAIVRMTTAGVCNTDLEIVRGYMGFEGTLGHELVGRVEQGPQRWVGKRVVAEINFACGRCVMCQRGLGRHCAERTVMGIAGDSGAFAELVSVPVANLHEVPEQLDDEQAVFTEPLAAAFEIVEQLQQHGLHADGSTATVLGDGKLGLLVAQVLASCGARVLAVGKHEAALSILADRGIDTTLLDRWDRARRDVVVDASGSADGLSLAISATRPRGAVVLKSTVAGQVSIDMAPLVIDEITLIGSRCGPFAPALAALAAGDVEVRPMVSARYPLADGARAIERAAEPGMLKVLLINPVG